MHMPSLSMPKFRLEVEGAENREKMLENEDLLPVPLENRTWGFWTFSIFWFSAVGTVAKWLGAASFLTFGISVWDGILCQFFGFLVVGILLAITGRAGSVYHINFPVYCRFSFGVYGAYWPVFTRALSACVWNGVNNVTGGQCIYVMLHSIFPSIARMPNHMPKSSGIDSANMLCFFIFWGLTGAACATPVRKWPILIKIKLAAYFLSCIGMLAMALVAADGVGDTLTRRGPAQGAERVWLIVRFTLLATASCATFVSNAADWQRNATKPRDPIIGQILGFPFSNFITTLVGLIVAASSTRVTPDGHLEWNPLVYLDLILTQNFDARHRAGSFFIALGFTYSSIFSSVFQNILPGGNDIASLAPKYLNLRRGFGVVMIMTVVINPWYLLGSAGVFVQFISSYQIFLFSIAAIVAVDYYFVHRGKLDLDAVYTADRQGKYWYTYGVNWRAIAAYVVGAAVNFAGFLDAMGVKGFNLGLKRSFFFAWITTSVAAGVVYLLLAIIFPQRSWVENKGRKFKEPSQDEIEAWSKARRTGGVIEEVDEKEAEAEAEREYAVEMDDSGRVGESKNKETRSRVNVLSA